MQVTVTAPELRDAARVLRDALKDRSYRATPLGLEVARYYRWKKNEWGATQATLRDYEAILARLALFYADLELADLEPPAGTDMLRGCWDHHWGDAQPRTRSKVRSVWVDFFDWCGRERGMRGNPARNLASPKKRGVRREPFGQAFVDQVIAAQTYLADKVGCTLILGYALRRGELQGVQLKDFDFEHRCLTVTGKGGGVRTLPIVEEPFWVDLGNLTLETGMSPESWLLYTSDTRKIRCPQDEAEETLQVGKGRYVYYRQRTVRAHGRRLSDTAVHNWWYDCLERAGVTGGKRSGLHMHRGRHTLASKIVRDTGNLRAAQEALGHADPSTTAEFYAQFDTSDLADVLRRIKGV